MKIAKTLRSDSPCANLEIFRLVLSLAAEPAWTLGQMDISTAVLQASGFQRTIYVKPPKEAGDPSGLWQLKAAAYGLVDSGHLWFRTSDHALVSEHQLTKSRYGPTLYFKNQNGKRTVVLVVQVDNYIYAGTETEVRSFESFLQHRFRVGALDRHRFTVMGCELDQDETGSIVLTQHVRLWDIDEKTLVITPHGEARSQDRDASAKELRAYRSVIGRILYLGRMSHPIFLYHAILMASKVAKLRTHHFKDLRALLKFDRKYVPTLRFQNPNGYSRFSLEAISDASMSPISEGGGRGVYLIIRRQGDILQPLQWCARKLRRVARSSSTAELLAASDAVSTLLYFQHLMEELSDHHDATMVVDSRALVSLATTIREPTEAANNICLAFIIENFTPHGVSTFSWTPGYCNIADGLTKDNRTAASFLLRALRDGLHPRHSDMIIISAETPLAPNCSRNSDGDDEIGGNNPGADDSRQTGGCRR